MIETRNFLSNVEKRKENENENEREKKTKTKEKNKKKERKRREEKIEKRREEIDDWISFRGNGGDDRRGVGRQRRTTQMRNNGRRGRR